MTNDKPAFYPCGCSRQKVELGRCDAYLPDGSERGGDFDEPVHAWFELSYSKYFAIQRTVLQSMPVEWQRDFVRLIEQIPETLDLTGGHFTFRVQAIDERGTFVRDDLADYERGRRRLPRKATAT